VGKLHSGKLAPLLSLTKGYFCERRILAYKKLECEGIDFVVKKGLKGRDC